MVLFLVFIIVPLIEIACFVLIGNSIGLWPTLAGVLATAIIGSLVLRWQGAAVLRDLRGAFSRGEIPARALGDAMLIGLGGLLLLLPGYFTDLVGILLMIPPVRDLIYHLLKNRVAMAVGPGIGPKAPKTKLGKTTIDLDDEHYRPR